MSASAFEADGVAYRTLRLSAHRQFILLRRLDPLLPALSGVVIGLAGSSLRLSAMSTLIAPLREAGDGALDAVFADCLSAIERVDEEPVGSPALSALLAIVMAVIGANFTAFFAMERPQFVPCPTLSTDKGFFDGPVSMPDGLGWLYAPVMSSPPLCTILQIEDGTYQIEHIARMNDLLTVRAENEARLRYAAEQG